MKLIKDGDLPFNVVGSLKLSEQKALLEIPSREFEPVSGNGLENVKVYRTKLSVYGQEMTVLVVRNPALLVGQMQSITRVLEILDIKKYALGG
ncbi:MAG: hypothetical protein AB1538_00495 [Bacillota bacterium]